MSKENTSKTAEEQAHEKPADSAAHQHSIPLLPSALMDDIIAGTKGNMSDFEDIANSNMTDAQRKRKVGPGTRNYGFIDKASDLAEVNPQFVQFFRITDMKNCIRNVETCRELATLLLSFWRAATNAMLIYSDDAYSLALLFYNNVKAMAKRGDPTAQELARELKTYFKKKNSDTEEPTQKALLRDVKALEHGTKDGKIVIENVKPHMTGGVHKVVDETFKGKASFKESEEGEIKE
jgi:hypothetical protein